ncbi:MAG: DUF3604 domain-containing protein [Pseudomonadales bacterium]
MNIIPIKFASPFNIFKSIVVKRPALQDVVSKIAVTTAALTLIAACGKTTNPPQASSDDSPATKNVSASASNAATISGQRRNAYFGDLHVHTMYSFDAFIFGTTASPDQAYEFAKGETLQHPGGFDMQLQEPLDFYGVSDHAFYLGALRAMTDPSTELYKHELARGMENLSDPLVRQQQFGRILSLIRSERSSEILDAQVFKSAWDDTIAAANRHNNPGSFTTFIAYEYTSSGDEFQNLHRNVIFSGDNAPALPFSRLDSTNPEDLWNWMDEQREQGYESLAIPHNSNGSNGEMFKLLNFEGNALDSKYAEQRMRNEPLVEISQVKGTSDTHPSLSPNDEWADFEIMPVRIASDLPSQPEGSYIRQAWENGLLLEQEKGFNPFKFGVIGSSDTHNASYAGDEDNYWSKVGVVDDEPVERGSVPMAKPDENGNEYKNTYYQFWSAAGLAGVWAEENTREAIYSAFRRKETFGTSGPRIKVRFFAGKDIPDLADPELLAKVYTTATAMGGHLIAEAGSAPEFLVWAAQDAKSHALQRVQIIKASVSDGKINETVYDVACSDGGKVDPTTQRCPDNSASVDLTDCSTNNKGDAELKAVWRDPSYQPDERAFYYVRALENPSCRWSTWDAIRSSVLPRADLNPTLQERAWSSPIWVN